jgi:hypothetical protein
MALTAYTFNAPAIYASALINGDLSSFDYYGGDSLKEYEQWCADNPEYVSEVTGTEGEPWTGDHNGLQTEMLTYTALSHEDDEDEES